MIKINDEDVLSKIVATIKMPKFEKFPWLAISIGGDGFKKFGWTRGKNYGIISLFGLYITFRMPYNKVELWSKGVEDGFDGARKTISYLINHINKQNVIIGKLIEEREEDEEDDEDGFNPLWN
jgi:hypothetical protein